VSAPRTSVAVPAATVFARGPFAAGGVVILEEEEAHHVEVRRLADGMPVRLVDGRGGVATARLVLDQGVVGARVVAATHVASPPMTEVLVGSGDRERFLSLVEKATELGATRVQAVVTERSQQVATRFQAAHVEKAGRRAREALKQCGGAWAPLVPAPALLADALRAVPPRAVRLLADPEGGALPGLREADHVVWCIGPEGGFTDAELAAVRGAGFRPVALARAVLRYETAALAALALTGHARLSTLQNGGA
jgi:16S rRNA (uracil1498-N3)-methyltransferase